MYVELRLDPALEVWHGLIDPAEHYWFDDDEEEEEVVEWRHRGMVIRRRGV